MIYSQQITITFAGMEKAALFWSGGKDSAYALYTILRQGQYEIMSLVTTLSQQYARISMHGVRESLLDRQTAMLQLPLLKMWMPDTPTNEAYEQVLQETLLILKSQGITTIIFGDIFLADLRLYRENQLAAVGLKAYFPLWGQPTHTLIHTMLQEGFKTMTCCISTAVLDKKFLGREIDVDFIGQLPAFADPCGENGEFHTFCFDGPLFPAPISFIKGEEKYVPLRVSSEKEEGFWYLDLL